MNLSKIIISRIIVSWIAFVAGIILYLLAAFVWGSYDGVPSLIFQSIIAVIVSAISVGIALSIGVGLSMFKKRLGLHGQTSAMYALIVIVLSLLLLIFGAKIGITYTYINPKTYLFFQALHPAAAIGGYCAIIFAIVNWPIKTKTKQ